MPLSYEQRASGSLPLGPINGESLRTTSTSISFDPLALLAILHNPRAAASAARLYKQDELGMFRSPHTMMIGGALPPFKVLVDHLASQSKSIHPAVELLKADTDVLEVSSNIGFTSLPRSYSNTWLSDQLAFRPSSIGMNDILIIHLSTIHGHRVLADPSDPTRSTEYLNPTISSVGLDLIGTGTTLLLVAGLVFSVLVGDFWSTVLFAAYFFHALASLAMSLTRMITTTDVFGRRVREDATIRYAVYQRTAGGKMVFKGRQDTLETWARSTTTFRRSPMRNALHWNWTITGALSAIASVICMVNMAGYLQLSVLGHTVALITW